MTPNDKQKKAVIYCRAAVATQGENAQIREQKKACQNFARDQGYSVERFFSDQASGNDINRLGLQEMLDYLGNNKGRTVIIEDASCLSRDVHDYRILRDAMTQTGATIKNLSLEHNHHYTNMRPSERVMTVLSQFQQPNKKSPTRTR